jgi:hypothetical protein
MDRVKGDPEYKALLKRMHDDFWQNNREIKRSMEEKGLL